MCFSDAGVFVCAAVQMKSDSDFNSCHRLGEKQVCEFSYGM